MFTYFRSSRWRRGPNASRSLTVSIEFLGPTQSTYLLIVHVCGGLDIHLIVPSGGRTPNLPQGDFRVRRRVILVWLEHLVQHHPSYRNGAVHVSHENLHR